VVITIVIWKSQHHALLFNTYRKDQLAYV
jgi:hypothetical protein